MKRIQNIICPKGVMTEKLERQEARILRQVEQAHDSIEDQINDKEDEIENIIDSVGKAGGADGTAQLQKVFTAYCEKKEELEALKRYSGYLDDLKAKLTAEVKVTPVPIPVQVINEDEK